MFAFRRTALLLALALPAMTAAFAQDSSSNPAPASAQAQPEQPTSGQISVQARIRARRQQRRAQAIQDTYAHLYDAYMGMGFQRFKPGPHSNAQRASTYAWNVGLTRYFDDRFGITVDGRGNYGTPYVGLNAYNITKPAISVYSAMAGPTYRFYLLPKGDIGVRVLGGFAHGNFSGDTNGIGTKLLGLYPDGNTYSLSASMPLEYNIATGMALRLAPEVTVTGFGSETQTTPGFTGGLVVRFGKQ